jgi:hypothetical protein
MSIPHNQTSVIIDIVTPTPINQTPVTSEGFLNKHIMPRLSIILWAMPLVILWILVIKFYPRNLPK